MGPWWKATIIYIVILFITATGGNHFMRGCQDIDQRCALVDEMRSAGGMKFQFSTINGMKICFQEFVYSYRYGLGK